jgi:small neutral amino acid transporter SnatA (MarC family)
MKPYLRFTLLVALCFFTALLIGFAVQYFFHYKIYVPLVIGSMAPILMAWKNIKNNQAKQ